MICPDANLLSQIEILGNCETIETLSIKLMFIFVITLIIAVIYFKWFYGKNNSKPEKEDLK